MPAGLPHFREVRPSRPVLGHQYPLISFCMLHFRSLPSVWPPPGCQIQLRGLGSAVSLLSPVRKSILVYFEVRKCVRLQPFWFFHGNQNVHLKFMDQNGHQFTSDYRPIIENFIHQANMVHYVRDTLAQWGPPSFCTYGTGLGQYVSLGQLPCPP